MSRLAPVVTRVATVVGVLRRTLQVLAIAGAVGVTALLAAVGIAGDWSGDALALMALLGALAGLAPVILARYAATLAPIRDLPEVSAAELRAAAGSLGAGLKAGQRRLVEARGLRRVMAVGRALWDLRDDLDTLRARGLAPAAAVVEAASPPRLVRVGFSAVAAPFLVVLGPLALLLALALA